MNWTAAGASDNYTAAIDTSGHLWTWGQNEYGQLGDGTYDDTPAGTTRVQEDTNNTWASVSVSDYHTAAIDTSGHLWTWGLNDNGQLGIGNAVNHNTPQSVEPTHTWLSVSTGDHHTVAIRSDGTLWAWGLNDNGQLGIGATGNRNTPVQESTHATNWVSVSAGDFFTVAIDSDGDIYAWGDNDFGQVHNWVTVPTPLP
jgi:alpha-tubulin suppressor-like RCC1 family protein